VASEPVALINWFKSLGVRLERIGLEAGPLSQWLYGALHESGLPVELLETRHVKAALSAMADDIAKLCSAHQSSGGWPRQLGGSNGCSTVDTRGGAARVQEPREAGAADRPRRRGDPAVERRHLASACWRHLPTSRRSMIRRVLLHRRRWERILGPRRRSISQVRPTSAVGLPRHHSAQASEPLAPSKARYPI
jgi:hypothetical protein